MTKALTIDTELSLERYIDNPSLLCRTDGTPVRRIERKVSTEHPFYVEFDDGDSSEYGTYGNIFYDLTKSKFDIRRCSPEELESHQIASNDKLEKLVKAVEELIKHIKGGKR